MNRILISFIILLVFSHFDVFSGNKKKLDAEVFIPYNKLSPAFPGKIVPMNNGSQYALLKDNKEIVVFSYRSGIEIQTLFRMSDQKNAPFESISDFAFSKDEKRILLETKKEKIYRHSYSAEYYIWDTYTQSLSSVSDHGPQQVATFSPDGERVAFARDNNLFVKTIRFGTEQQLTFDGKKNEIINGIPDWVYEEEFAIIKAFEWSPDSKMLAWVKFNEYEVPEYPLHMYQGLSPELKENSIYPHCVPYKYPKAGENNSEVSVHVYDLKTRATLTMDTGDHPDHYIPAIKWSPSGNDLLVFRLNRRQNELDILYANPYTGQSRTVLTERNQWYIDDQFSKNFTFLDDGEHFVLISERDGWSHLYLYRNNGILVKQLTSGAFDVSAFYGYDIRKKLFYYQAAQKSPLQREVCLLSLDGRKKECLSDKAGTNEAQFSSDYTFYRNTFSSAKELPETSLYSLPSNKKLAVLEDNMSLKNKLQEYYLPEKEFFRFSTSEGIELNGYRIRPSHFDSTQKYPVVLYQYSGPGSQEVVDRWESDWHWFLSEQGFLVVCVDPRGTLARGEAFRKSTYMQLGRLESDDLVETARYMTTLPWVDGERIGIWGWSYGGFSTILSMEKGGTLFRAGVAVAPVTHWKYYDSVYTERFMRKPGENPSGYNDYSAFPRAGDIRGKLLLIHGTADDNVHVQNTLEFAEVLVQEGIPFDMHLYTNRNHSIYGGNTRLHLYTKILNHFLTHLK